MTVASRIPGIGTFRYAEERLPAYDASYALHRELAANNLEGWPCARCGCAIPLWSPTMRCYEPRDDGGRFCGIIVVLCATCIPWELVTVKGFERFQRNLIRCLRIHRAS